MILENIALISNITTIFIEIFQGHCVKLIRYICWEVVRSQPARGVPGTARKQTDIKISQAKWPQTALLRSFVKKCVQSKPMDNPIREYYEYLVNTLKFNDSMSNYNN